MADIPYEPIAAVLIALKRDHPEYVPPERDTSKGGLTSAEILRTRAKRRSSVDPKEFITGRNSGHYVLQVEDLR